MKGVLIDSNVLLDIFTDDPDWADWSESILEEYSHFSTLYINPVIYSEISIGFKHIEDVEATIMKTGLQMLDFPKEALFLAGKVFLNYRKRQGYKKSPLPDFFIGAQAAILNIELITRDLSRYRSYFPTVSLIAP